MAKIKSSLFISLVGYLDKNWFKYMRLRRELGGVSVKRFIFLMKILLTSIIVFCSVTLCCAQDSKAIRERINRKITVTQRQAAAKRASARCKVQSSSKLSAKTAALNPGGTPNYFGPEPNWVNSPLPVVNPSTGVISGGIRKFMDSLPGLGIENINELGQYIPVAVPDTTTYSGYDYYEIELVEYSEKMHSDLKPTKLRGYVQTNTTDPNLNVPHYLGPMIMTSRDRPVRIKFTNKLPTGTDGNLFLPVDTTVMGAGMGPYGMNPPVGDMNYTQNRAVIHLHGGISPWISDGTPHQWITPAGEVTSYPKGVSVNNVPDMADPGDGSVTLFYTNQQSARLMFYHDHTYGITRLNVYAGEVAGYIITDDTEQQLISSGIIPSEQIPLTIQDKTFLPDAITMASNDPTWPFPLDSNMSNLWLPHVYMPNQNPNDLDGVNALGRWDYGPWFWPPWPTTYPPVTLPDGTVLPTLPKLSMGMETFMDTPVINGTAYPYLDVEPKAYRFRILNGSNDRYYNLQLYEADPTAVSTTGINGTEVKMLQACEIVNWPSDWTKKEIRDGGFPDPNLRGPDMIQIGNESGFLATPVVFTNIPIGYDREPKSMTVGNIKEHNIFMGPAERADVIVDFSQFAGKNLILYNDSPAPVPAGDARYDYYTNDPDLTEVGGAPTTLVGYGPNMRTLMQIRVANSTPADPYDLTALENAFKTTSKSDGVFVKSQNPIIVPQAGYDSAYNASFPDNKNAYARIYDNSLTFTPLDGTRSLTIQFQPKSIAEEFENDYGRMSGFLGVEVPFTNGMNQTTIFYNYMDPTTETIDESITPMPPISGDGTQIWKITHNGVDTHAIHFHLFDVQLINRVDWAGVVKPPEANELGWKDTVRMNPLEDCIVALRPVAPKLPFGIPDSVRLLDPTMPEGSTTGFKNVDPQGNPIIVTNTMTDFGWEYMWHCHMLSHEEMDMMRPIVLNVARKLASASVLSGAYAGSVINLTWTDPTPPDSASTWGNPSNEIGYRIERSNSSNGAFQVIGQALANATKFTDTNVAIGGQYRYRVITYNVAGETASNIINVETVPPAPSQLTAAATGPQQVVLNWVNNTSTATSLTLQRAVDSGFTQELATFSVGAQLTTYTDNTVVNNTTYYYRILATNSIGNSQWSNTATVTTLAFLLAAPTNLRAITVSANNVVIGWSYSAKNATGFYIERSANNGKNWIRVGVVTSSNLSFQNNGLSRRTTYQYRVQAYNSKGVSDYSNILSVTTL